MGADGLFNIDFNVWFVWTYDGLCIAHRNYTVLNKIYIF